MSTTYRYRFAGFDAATLTEIINSMGSDGAGISIASAPSGVNVDISVPDGFDVALLDSAVAYPYRWVNTGVAITPNIRVATIRVKRVAALDVSEVFAQLPLDAISALGPALGMSIVGGDIVPAVNGLMRIDAQFAATLLGLTSVAMRVVVNPGALQYVVCASESGPAEARCSVQFGILAGVPVRIEIKKSGGVGDASLVTSERQTFVCANAIT